MPTSLIWGYEVADYLIDSGLVADGRTPAPPLPPVWVDPDEGAEAPEGFDEMVVTVFSGLEIPTDWHQGFMQERAMEVRVRAKSRPEAELFMRSVRGLMEEKKHTLMGRLLVQQSKMWRGVQLLASDDQSVTLTQSFRVAVRIEDLTV